jgi:hypothetical protein
VLTPIVELATRQPSNRASRSDTILAEMRVRLSDLHRKTREFQSSTAELVAESRELINQSRLLLRFDERWWVTSASETLAETPLPVSAEVVQIGLNRWSKPSTTAY